jgi:hypothetical protein
MQEVPQEVQELQEETARLQQQSVLLQQLKQQVGDGCVNLQLFCRGYNTTSGYAVAENHAVNRQRSTSSSVLLTLWCAEMPAGSHTARHCS